MNTIIHITAISVLVIIFGLIAAVLARQLSLLKLAGVYQEQDRERLKTQIELLRQLNVTPKTSAWNGLRQFRVIAKPKESEDISSFFLKPIDEKPLPPFQPGQFLTFELNTGGETPLVRCYSISDSHNPDYYRVSIKRDERSKNSPSGSQFFHDHVAVGSIIKVRAPAGSFTRNPADDRPAVFLAGGVGITPLLCMLQSVCDANANMKNREIWFFLGVRDGAGHVMKKVLQELARNNSWLRLNVVYSRPRDNDKLGVDYHHKGYVAVELLKKLLPSNNYAYYICAGPDMMNSLIADLKAWGVPAADVHYEAFGPESVKQAGDVTMKKVSSSRTVKIKFALSNKEESYSADKPLLALAEKSSKNIPWGCKSGSCGTCKTLIQSGEVTYANPPAASPESGYCLPCVCIAKTDLVLEA